MCKQLKIISFFGRNLNTIRIINLFVYSATGITTCTNQHYCANQKTTAVVYNKYTKEGGRERGRVEGWLVSFGLVWFGLVWLVGWLAA